MMNANDTNADENNIYLFNDEFYVIAPSVTEAVKAWKVFSEEGDDPHSIKNIAYHDQVVISNQVKVRGNP
jgi:hypothetical protein